MPVTPQSLTIDPRGVEYVVNITDDDETPATSYTDRNGDTEFAFPITISEPTTFFFGEGVVGQTRNATTWNVSAVFNGVECATPDGPARVDAQNWQSGVLVIDLADGAKEIATLLSAASQPLTPQDLGSPGSIEWISVSQGEVAIGTTGSYFKGSMRLVEPGAYIIDGWGKIEFGGGGTDAAVVIDFAPLLAAFNLGNAFRATDDMAVGHASGTIGGSPASYLHMAVSTDDGECAVRLVDLDAAEIVAPIQDGDVLHFQISVTTWSD